MKVPELVDSRSRFRVAEACVGLTGCVCVCCSAWTSRWLDHTGLWSHHNLTTPDHTWSQEDTEKALEAERVFALLSSLMAVSSALLCVVFALCWSSGTLRSYSNTRSLLRAGQTLDPSTLLLFTLMPTGFFFLLSWALFTRHHISEIRDDITRLGASYWLGLVGWASLLGVLPLVFLLEKWLVPDLLPELVKAAEVWWTAPAEAHARTFSRPRRYRPDP